MAAAKLYAIGSRSTTVRLTATTPPTASVQSREPLRGETFVTRKITRRGVDRAEVSGQLYLGNLDAKRDWFLRVTKALAAQRALVIEQDAVEAW